MRITHEMLLKVAQDTVAQRVRSNRSIVAAYLYGSVLGETPLLGNTTDIDLFFVHEDEISAEREVVRITDDVHLDIVHSPRGAFRQLRELRQHPWQGPTLYGCRILYDPQHFLDFVQASVRGQFSRPDHVVERSRNQFDLARQIWFSFDTGESPSDVQRMVRYLQALEAAANAIALLSGDPLTERRFLLDFPVRAQAIGRSGLPAGLAGLLSAHLVDENALNMLIENWSATFDFVQKWSHPPDLSAVRRHYYSRAYDSFVAGDHPHAALWPILHSWTKMIEILPFDAPVFIAWQNTCRQLGFLGDGFPEKIAALDAFLDTIEEIIDQWAQANGA